MGEGGRQDPEGRTRPAKPESSRDTGIDPPSSIHKDDRRRKGRWGHSTAGSGSFHAFSENGSGEAGTTAGSFAHSESS